MHSEGAGGAHKLLMSQNLRAQKSVIVGQVTASDLQQTQIHKNTKPGIKAQNVNLQFSRKI